VATAGKTSISTGTSSSYMGISSVSSRDIEIKREIEEGTGPRRSRRIKASAHSITPLGLAASAPPKRHSNPKVVKRETRPRRRRLDNSGKGLRETRIKQEFEDDTAVSLGRNIAASYKNIVDEASFAQASDALFVEKKVTN
jgi:hypothetical protein